MGSIKLLWICLLWAGDIYIHTDAEGTVTFTDSPQDSRYTVFLREKPLPTPKAVRVENFPYLNHFDALFQEASRQHGVPFSLLKAVCLAESGMNANAVSKAGAQGLMQLMPATARDLGVTDSFDPAQNINGGAQYLAAQYKRFHSYRLALAAYNAGPGAVKHHKGIPPFEETQAYVPKVMALWEHLMLPSEHRTP
jgi:soluble lytic murein transglycosylase-like protein